MISFVIPVHNEEAVVGDAVRRLIREFSPVTSDFEIIPVENGSRDRTWEILQELSRGDARVKPVRSAKADYGFALKTGLRAARGEKIISDEIDLLEPNFHRAAVAALDNADLVIASKRHPEACDDRSLFRRCGTFGVTLLLKLSCGLKSSDTHGPKAWRAETARKILDLAILDGDLFASEVVLRAERLGMRITELPLTVHEIRSTSIPLLKRVPRVLRQIRELRRVL